MHKVTKILLKLIPATILLLIFVPLMVSILLTIPAVQSRLVRYATTFASDFLDTKVSIGRISGGAFGNITISDFYVEDLNRDTLIFAQNVNVNILRVGLSTREVNLGHCKVTGGGLYLRQGADSVINIRPIIEKLTPEASAKKSVVISFNTLEIEDFDVAIDLLNHRNPEYGVDFGDMVIGGIDGEVDDFTIDGAAVHANIKRLSCVERSGFELLDATGELYISTGVVSLTDATIDSRYSHATLPYLSVVGASWLEYQNFVERVDISARIENSTLMSDDVAYFAPRLRDWGVTVTSLDGDFDGEVNDLKINIEDARFEEASAVAAELQIRGMPDVERSIFDINLKELRTTSADINRLTEVIRDKPLTPKITAIIDKIQELRCSGKFSGSLANFTTSVVASSSVGDASANLKMESSPKGGQFIEGDVATENLEIGKLLNINDIGATTLSTTLRGSLHDIYSSSFAQGIISQTSLRGAPFYNIAYSGAVEDGDFRGEANSANKGLYFDATADIGFGDERRSYDVDLRVKELDLGKLKVNKRDSVSILTTHITAQADGNTLDDMVGNITLLDGEYRYNADTLRGGGVILTANNSAERKGLTLESEYADISYSSPNSYADSWHYLKGAILNYLPSLYAMPKDEYADSEEQAHNKLDGYSMVNVNIKNITPLAEIFSNNMNIAPESNMELIYNTSAKDLSLMVKSKYVELNSVLAIDIDMGATNLADSLSLYGSVKEFLVGTRQFDNLSFSGGAVDDRIHLTAGYNDTDDNSSANIDGSAELSIDPERGRMAKVQLLPSQLKNGDNRWDVKAQAIEIDRGGVLIDDFMIRNAEQELLVEGLASRSTNDTLRVNMHDFDLSILSTLTEALGYNVEGLTNGKVVVSSALYNMRVDANVLLDSVSVNELPAPPMRVRAAWDTEQNQARVSLTNRIKGDTLIRGYFIPSKVKYYGRLDVDSLHVGLLNAPLRGILSEAKGYADARLTISGERRAAQLEGYVDVRDVEAKVDYTNVTYRIPKARIEVENNELVCQNVEVLDPLGRRGAMTMSVDLQHLTNIGYHVRLNVNDFLALDTTPADNDLFYGKMFASGVVNLVGDKVGVNMDITATTRNNSEFFMPLMSKSNISTAEFITFVSHDAFASDTTVVSQIKRRFFENDRRKKSGSSGNININMALNVTPDADFQLVIDPTVGDVMRGRGEGRINLRVNPKSNIFDMYGDYTITEGSYLFTLRNIINKKFVINPGSTIQWSGDPLDAKLNIEAVYKLKTSLQPLMSDESTRAVPVDCTIYLADNLMHPDVSFGISLPTGDTEQQAIIANLLNDQETISRQFFYLMLANSFIPESAAGATSNLGLSTSAATGFELLTNQLSNWLSSSNYNVVIRYRPESELTGDELDFGISRSLVNNRLLVEVEGNYSNNDISTAGESEASAASNFAGEAYITWLIDRSGALRLRGFTQTIDTYDENQGLQETGVGIYYKESFDNFKDLKERVKARFSRKGVGLRERKRIKNKYKNSNTND